MEDHIETREVLAGAYHGQPKTLLSHAVLVDFYGGVIRVLCRRVKLDSLADRHAGDPHAPPTCPECLRRLHRRMQLHYLSWLDAHRNAPSC